ncbi:LCP family protein [Bifidobacterium sp. UBA744]|uniref:LCP family glycopolymer transferase n=1 Tax=Bifidobacterium sp. UBA744 TaxID=1946112 RepID=UPI0025BC7239|nr:LCP family protein [Bifidobacterium sp. UBA744]
MTKPTGSFDPRDTPPSFIPSGTARRSSTPPSFSPGRASASGRPAAQPRRSAHRASAASGDAQTPAAPARRATRPSRSRVAARRRRRPAHMLLTAFLIVALVAGLGTVSAWNWVNGQLDRQNMLTSAANTAPQTWLILGSDERDADDGTGINDATQGFRNDTILVLTKPTSGNSSLISIPRDSLVEVNGKKMKINSVAQYAGYPALTGVVERITGMKIDHAAMIHFGGLQNVVNALGGVDLCYDRTVHDEKSGLNWQAGCHTADGSTALAFSRMRYSDPKGDFGRAERQRQVIGAIASKASSKETLTNVSTVRSLIQTGLGALTVDEQASPWSLAQMALAFKSASGEQGVTGSVYWTNADYRGAGVGSSVLLDATRNTELFSQLANGTHAPGTVGGQ